MNSESKTKYLILVPDGMADVPVPELEDRTPLAVADTPWMDRMSSCGAIGTARTVPQGMEPGSDVANLSIVGYSPKEVYTGRAPFEAASMGIELGKDDVAFRLNLVWLDKNYTIMGDHSADHISSEEARELISALSPYVEVLGMKVYSGVSYRNLLVWMNGPDGCVTRAPHDFPGHEVDRLLPAGNGSDTLLRLIVKSWKLFENHPVNVRRLREGRLPANSIWPWGQGKAPQIKTLEQRFGITGSVVAAVDLIKGIGKYAGLEPLTVRGATGYLDTNYDGKVRAALRSLETKDFVFLHVEAPDEASHSGKRDLKIQAISDFDAKVVGPVLQGLKAFPKWRILLMPDHHTPVEGRIHTDSPVPFMVLDSDQWDPSGADSSRPFSEANAEASGIAVEDATKLIEVLVGKASL